MARRPTIKDIADRAEVSIATVSHVINGTRYVSPELTTRVKQSIDELDYRPHEIARSLRINRTRTIGLIVPDNSNPFFADVAKGVEDAGFEAGYSVILCNSNAMLERELAHIQVLLAKQVDGIIFFSTTMDVTQVLPVVDQGIATAIFYREVSGLNVDTFRVDNIGIGYAATRHLLDLGHRKIACIRPASSETASGRRVEGYVKALRDFGVQPSQELMPRGDNRIGGGEYAVREMLADGCEFTAIFACNDAMAIGAMRTLRDQGFQIPQDISIVGADDITLAAYAEPPLTTVAQPKQEAGRLAVEYLTERMEGRFEGNARDVMLETDLVVRSSTSRPREDR